MKSSIAFFVVLLATLRFVHADPAGVYWTSTPISAAAVANDPALANYQVFDLMVQLRGNQFSFGGLRMNLPGGSVYNHPFGSNIPPAPAAVAQFPALEFDTFVSVPPPATCLVRDALAITGIPIMSGSVIDVSMFSNNSIPPQPLFGEFLIGRFTVPSNVIPQVNPASFVEVIGPNLRTPIPPIPEPVSTVMLLCGLISLQHRKRRF